MRFSRHHIGGSKLVDLVPVANVVLLLIFFFLLSWSFVLQPGIEVRLPETRFRTASQQGRHMITLKLGAKDALILFFDEKSVDLDGLRKRLEVASEKSHGDWITINADHSVSHGDVQQVADMAMQQGFHVTIATQRAVPAVNEASKS